MPYTHVKQKEYQRKWLAKRRADWFATNGPCVRCGSWDNLELDHADPATKVEHRIWSWAEKRRLRELAKCQALCEDCHKAKTAEQRKLPPPVHGTHRMYKTGCRCDKCVAKHNTSYK